MGRCLGLVVVVAMFVVCTWIRPAHALDPQADAPNDPGISVELLTRGKRVIPLTSVTRDLRTTHVKPPDLLVRNRGPAPISLREVRVVLTRQGQESTASRVPREVLIPSVTRANARFTQVLARPEERDTLLLALGRTALGTAKLSAGESMAPGQAQVIPLSRLLYVNHTGRDAPDGLVVSVWAESDAATTRVDLALPLSLHVQQGTYAFPLRKPGTLVGNLPMNLSQHRAMHSQEFAVDAVMVRQSRDGSLRTCEPPRNHVDRCHVNNQPVLAPAAGVVVDVGTRFPDAEVADPSRFTEQGFFDLMRRLAPRIGFTNTVAGNYVVLDHRNGEYSAFMHLAGGSITSKVGDAVRRGDVVGRVGNTGHSAEPHLHFQLMDGPDFLTANGLPVMFEDVPPQEMSPDVAESNALGFSDFLVLGIE
jgi:hypothetical protein